MYPRSKTTNVPPQRGTGPSEAADSSTITRRTLFASAGAAAGSLLAAPYERASASDQSEPVENVGTVWWVELVAANDLEAAAHYGEVIGWSSRRVALSDSTKLAQPEEPAYTLFLANGSEVAGAYRADPRDPVKNKPMWIVYFQVDNVDKAIKRAIDKGGRILISPYDVPGAARMAVLADSDGVIYGVATPL